MPRFVFRFRSLLLLAFISVTVAAAPRDAFAEKTEDVPASGTPEADSHGWDSRRIHRTFHAEGASVGDLNGDGHADVVEGTLWYPGPQFDQPREIAPAKSFAVRQYSDQFFSHVIDVNKDGANDVISIGFPGTPARLYVNPGHESLDQAWDIHEITAAVDNESPAIIDLVPGGLPEIVCGNETQYGYYSAGADATELWTWHPVSRPGTCAGRFEHALGVGDVNGDGRLDVINQAFWWQQPSTADEGQLWQRHRWAPPEQVGGGAQICVEDIDGDGDNDLVTSLDAHGYGLAWFEQSDDGSFRKHTIMSDSSTDNPYGVAFSQLHAVALRDVDGDGLKDIVTGKRWMAHGGHDPGGLQSPVLYWFRCTRSGQGVEFVPYKVHDDSGVGVDITLADLNGDAKLDVVSCSKNGLTLHFQRDAAAGERPERWQETEGRDQSTYAEGLAPDQAAAQMMVPDGFSVDLIASEPELTQPIAMCFDARGRIWVVEGHTYPTKAPDGEGQDRVLILEDTDGDGTFDSRKVFTEGLNLASGIEVGFGGVFIGAAPQLLFIPDADRDDVPDGPPEVLLDGWGYEDTHETLNSFTWGPDGWLYGCHGVFTHSRVGKPGTADEQRVPLNAGVWRYHPTDHRFEVFAHGTSNPWGVDFDQHGECFISACVIPHLYHMIQGGRYQRQGGRHFNSSTYEDIKTIADHSHYTGNIREHAFWGENRELRPASGLDTSILGGGHAHCGLAIYNADVFPKKYRGELFFHNLHGHRVVRESVAKDGSGFVGLHRPDFALARDHHEIGVGIMVGPDGALYTSDWQDPQTCHHRDHDIWNRTDGRLFRIRYGDVRSPRMDLWAESDGELVDRLASDNGMIARQASRILQERSAAGQLDKAHVSETLSQWFEDSDNTRDRLRAVWAMHVIGGLDSADVISSLGHEDPHVRGWAVRLIGQRAGGLEAGELTALQRLSEHEDDLVVQRHLASILQSLPVGDRLILAGRLLSKPFAASDRNLPYLLWYGIEPTMDATPDRALELLSQSGWNRLLRLAFRRLTETPEGRSLLIARLADNQDAAQRVPVLEELDAAVRSRAGLAKPESWPAAYQLLARSESPRVLELARSLAVQFGDEAVMPHFRRVLSDSEQPAEKRLQALASLRTAKDPTLAEQLRPLLSDPAIASTAASALAAFDDPKTAPALIAGFENFDSATKTAALGTLVSRPAFAESLVAAMESGKIPPADVPAFIVRQITQFDDAALNDRLQTVWGRIGSSSEDMQAQYKKYRDLLTRQSIADADASRGRALYQANCGNCHQLFGTGGEIGPAITGANRTDINYWLENILEPQALIGRAYQMTSILTVDGRVVAGIVTEENEDAVTIQTATEKVILPRDEIEQSVASDASLMPQGQLEPMTEQQVRDLFKYLMSPKQVPLPE
ncbi:c-type cytochrome [Roseiconus nitratireducens]|uniref:C-type cytochrome n=1 Tax=Roseiconus nitratireducens TaxID=2605748 RepID=A0A5M6CXP7_9BACT|nr:PVC-type heme-binding CxxCH protein [Roseiconus nitratireducens]KAA5539716.1 c-type cytochrome [Roseiconus nitratireducens]